MFKNEIAALKIEVKGLKAENARLRSLLGAREKRAGRNKTPLAKAILKAFEGKETLMIGEMIKSVSETLSKNVKKATVAPRATEHMDEMDEGREYVSQWGERILIIRRSKITGRVWFLDSLLLPDEASAADFDREYKPTGRINKAMSELWKDKNFMEG